MPLLKSTANLKTVVLINSNIGVAKVGNLSYKLKKRKTLKPLHSGSETSALTTRTVTRSLKIANGHMLSHAIPTHCFRLDKWPCQKHTHYAHSSQPLEHRWTMHSLQMVQAGHITSHEHKLRVLLAVALLAGMNLLPDQWGLVSCSWLQATQATAAVGHGLLAYQAVLF